MSSQPYRLATGGAIDRDRPLGFSFDGKPYQGYAGDTLASALLANGVRLVGRSFKYHRPRGISSAGPEEPNALVVMRDGARAEPNIATTMAELYDGLVATSQNRWPSLAFDLWSLNSLLGPFIPVGFYYKTFMWPGAKGWLFYEKFIRRGGGLGTASRQADPDRYDTVHAFCDVLVVGAGPAGLAAARSAGDAGCRVMLVDERTTLGGALRFEGETIDGAAAGDWADDQIVGLAAQADVTLLPRTTAFGYYDGNTVGLLERANDHLPKPPEFAARQRLWIVRARQVVLATGAIERPLVFGNNDKPGVMLASAAQRYANQYAVKAGERAVVGTNNDSAYAAALDLHAAGIAVAAIADARSAPPAALIERARAAGIEVLVGQVVSRVNGRRHVTSAEIGVLDDAGTAISGGLRRIACDLVCVSGGWQPSVHLHSQSGSRPVYDEALTAFVPGEPRQAQLSAGACTGRADLADCIAEGSQAGAQAAAACGFDVAVPPAPAAGPNDGAPLRPLWEVPEPAGHHGKKFIDPQNDVTADGVVLAHREGYASVEHLKRYTALGMGTEQGKTGNVNGLAIMARERGLTIPQVGTTTFRPPYTPVAIGAFAGRAVGKHFRPTRLTPIHDWHLRHGAVMVETGAWLRPRYYPQGNETIREAYIREATHVREKVGMVDVTTLGKIDVQGPDAAEFLNRVYCNGWKTLPIGKARFGLMLREDGIVLDDGTTSRVGEHQYYMTTTTANAAGVMTHLEYYLQVVWPELKVHVTSISEQWAQIAVAGPRARAVLEAAIDGINLSNEGLPFMGVADGRLKSGIPARVFRISFSGELAYEIGVPAGHGEAAWQQIYDAGQDMEIIAYGLEALGAMRIEKGHVAGPEFDGRTTLEDLGLGRMASTKKHFIGRAMLGREGLFDPARPKLVGLESVSGVPLRGGSQIVEQAKPNGAGKMPMLGHVTSTTYSPVLGKNIALALVQGGLEREGQMLYAAHPLRGEHTPVRVVQPVFFDPEGERVRG